MIHQGRAKKLVLLLLILLVPSFLVVDAVGKSSEAKGGGGEGEGESATACGSSSYNYLSALLRLMIPCKAAVAPFSPTLPDEECCSAVRELGQPCLCMLLAGPLISGADRRMLIRLPSTCATYSNDEGGATGDDDGLRQDLASCTAT